MTDEPDITPDPTAVVLARITDTKDAETGQGTFELAFRYALERGFSIADVQRAIEDSFEGGGSQ